MAKKIIAKTNISYGTAEGESVEFKPGDVVDPAKYGMTKEQLAQLYDAGALVVEGEDEPAKEEPVKATPAKATTSGVKSSGTSNAA